MNTTPGIRGKLKGREVQGYKSITLEGMWSKTYDLALSHIPILPLPLLQQVLVFMATRHISSN